MWLFLLLLAWAVSVKLNWRFDTHGSMKRITWGICWLNARDSNLAAEIVQFAQLYMNLEVPQKRGESPLNLKQQVEWCWQNWYTPPTPLGKGGVREEGEGLVLVVLDDVTDLRSCRGVLPTANRFRVLMTTRLRGAR
jgi:hypothetical protein